jgi:hypothetical protein
MPARGSAMRRRPAHLLPAHERQELRDPRGLGQPTGAEVPRAAQDPRRDVEPAAALRMTGRGVVEQRRGLGVHLDPVALARARVDPRQQAVGAVARILLLEALDLAARARGKGARGERRVRVQLQRARTAHRLEAEGVECHPR